MKERKIKTISISRMTVSKRSKIWKNMRNTHLNIEELKISDSLYFC